MINQQTENIITELASRLNDKELQVRIESYVNWIYEQGDTERAYRFYSWLKNELSKKTNIEQEMPSIWYEYQKLLGILGLMALQKFNNLETEDYFQNYIAHGLNKLDSDIVDQVEANLLTIIEHEQRSLLKQKLCDILVINNSPLVEVSFDNFKLRTIADWLKNYVNNLGQTTSDSFNREQYLTHSEALKNLDPQKREVIRRLINLFEYLKKPSNTSEGLEEKVTFIEEGKRVVLDKGRVYELPGESSQILKQILDLRNKESNPTLNNESKSLVLSSVINTSIVKPALPQINSNIFIHTAPQTFKSTKPALVFDMEDEKEADKHRDKAGTQPVLEHVIRQFVEETIKGNNLIFKDEVNQRRFVQLMVSRLKDVRGPLEIAEALRKPIETGGLGMPEEKADQVPTIVEAAKQEFEDKRKQGELKASLPTPVYTPEPVVKVQPLKPAFDPEAARVWREQMLREIQTQNQSVSPGAGSPASQQAATQRPQLVDVKAPPKVVGPLEELRSLTLIDFRRLGATPLEALQKIKGKIDLLGETSIGRKLEAVKAWKSSVVYQQYLRLGRESIEQGKHISAMVGSHEALGEPVLTENEFTAIADFNARLRF